MNLATMFKNVFIFIFNKMSSTGVRKNTIYNYLQLKKAYASGTRNQTKYFSIFLLEFRAGYTFNLYWFFYVNDGELGAPAGSRSSF